MGNNLPANDPLAAHDAKDNTATGLSAVFSESRERKIVWLLCILGAIHVFVFSAAFPFFNNVDETAHFDLVLKYSHGDLPRRMDNILPDSADYVALMNSHAYFGRPEQFPGGQLPPPLWTEPAPKMQQALAAGSAEWQKLQNYEVSQTPLYYLLAGSWWHIGQWLHLQGGRLVYWLRFFNIIQIAALIWLSYLAARIVFPENLFMQLGVPALLAFMPQTAFYSLGNDLLPALCFGVAFICLLKWLSSENPSPSLGAATGLAFAATYLSKMTNLPLLAVATAAVLAKAWLDVRHGKFKATLPALAVLLLCSELPVIGWMMWCKSNFGDLTGSANKAQFLGWTVKPFAQWWGHPIFTPDGFWTYLSGQLGTFWQGEFLWHYQPLVFPGTNAIYTLLSLALLVVALPALLPRFSNITPLQRHTLQLSMLCFLAALGFFAVMSIVYDFHDCPYPSRHYPYFTSGRLLLGALIPFLLLFVYGLNRALNRFGNSGKFSILAAMILAMLILETATDWRVFSNGYNWFHLP